MRRVDEREPETASEEDREEQTDGHTREKTVKDSQTVPYPNASLISLEKSAMTGLSPLSICISIGSC